MGNFESMDLEKSKKAVNAWVLYDWANSAFATTIMGVVLPTYFADYIAKGASVPIWGKVVAIGSLLAALLSPILGAIADFKATKKKFMAFFVILGVISTALLWFVVSPADQTLCIVLYILGTIGFAGSLVFYDSLLPHVSKDDDEMDQISSRGYALGYIGGGLLLLINVLMIFFSGKLLPHLPAAEATAVMMRLSLLSVAVWWAVFSIPIFLRVSEPAALGETSEIGKNVFSVGFNRLGKAFAGIREFKDLFLFLITFFIYSNGIGTIITMAASFASDLQFGMATILGTFLMVQFVAAPFAILFGKLGKKLGNKKAITIALVIYALVAIFGYFMQKEWHMFLLGFGVATVQGGSQALSRSLIGKLMPKSRSAEFYGFFSVSEKFNTVVGPALMAFIAARTGNPRLSIVSLVIFFVAGMIMLRFVNVERGIAQAEAVDAQMVELKQM
jgi:UMF1 family MFS transporter